MMRPLRVSSNLWLIQPFADLSVEAKVLYLALAARGGKGGRSVVVMRSEIFPSASEDDIADWWVELHHAGLIRGGHVGTLDVVVDLHPEVVQVMRSRKKATIPLSVRRGVALAHGAVPGETIDACCAYCGRPGRIHWPRLFNGRPGSWVTFSDLEMDHIYPESRGGPTTVDNMTLACRPCNRAKGAKVLAAT